MRAKKKRERKTTTEWTTHSTSILQLPCILFCLVFSWIVLSNRRSIMGIIKSPGVAPLSGATRVGGILQRRKPRRPWRRGRAPRSLFSSPLLPKKRMGASGRDSIISWMELKPWQLHHTSFHCVPLKRILKIHPLFGDIGVFSNEVSSLLKTAVFTRLYRGRKLYLGSHSIQNNRFRLGLGNVHGDVTSCFNTSVNSEARDCSAFPAGDSGHVSKMFEPCSQQTQRFYKKKEINGKLMVIHISRWNEKYI